MKLFLYFTQLLLVLFKLQGALQVSWWIVLIPMELILFHGLLLVAAFFYGYAIGMRRRRAMTPGERAAEDLAHYYATHRSKF
jgi:hypothetical protein